MLKPISILVALFGITAAQSVSVRGPELQMSGSTISHTKIDGSCHVPRSFGKPSGYQLTTNGGSCDLFWSAPGGAFVDSARVAHNADSAIFAARSDSARAAHIADTAKRAGVADSSRVSGLSDSAKKLVLYARTTALHDTADTLRKYTRDRIKDSLTALRTASTLQAAYAASTAPQITTSAAKGALIARRGTAGGDPDAVVQVQDGGGNPTITLSGNGQIAFDGRLVQGVSEVLDASKNLSVASATISGATANTLARFDASKYLVSYALLATDIPSLDAAKITTGTFASGRMPAFSGDVTTTAGSTVATLANSGVIPGGIGSSTNIPILSIDAKGRVTSSSSVTVTPAWADITGKPAVIGTVTSVGIVPPSLMTAGAPVTGSGNLSLTWNGASTNLVLADGTTIPSSTFITGGPYLLASNPQWFGLMKSASGTLALEALLSGGLIKATAGTGVLALASASDIPALDAAKITTGTFPDAMIASASTWNAKVGGSGANGQVAVFSGTNTVGSSDNLKYANGALTITGTTQANAYFRGTSGALSSFYVSDAEAGFRDQNSDNTPNSYPIYWTRGAGGLMRLTRPINATGGAFNVTAGPIQINGTDAITSARALSATAAIVSGLAGTGTRMVTATSTGVLGASSGITADAISLTISALANPEPRMAKISTSGKIESGFVGDIAGRTDGATSCTGCVGEYLTGTRLQASAINSVFGGAVSVADVSITAGVWLVWGRVAMTSSLYAQSIWIGTSATMPTDGTDSQVGSSTGYTSLVIEPRVVNVAGGASMTIWSQNRASGGTTTTWGNIYALRIR